MKSDTQNIEDIRYNNRKILIRLTVFGIVLSSVLIAIYGIIRLIVDEKDQHLDKEEAIIEYGDDNTYLAGIEIILSYGVKEDQYEIIKDTLDSVLKKAEPDSNFFQYVENTIALEGTSKKTDSTISDEERLAILSELSSGDSTVSIFGPNGSEKEASSHLTPEELSTISLKISSSNGNEYQVKLDSGSSVENMKIEITNSNGERL